MRQFILSLGMALGATLIAGTAAHAWSSYDNSGFTQASGPMSQYDSARKRYETRALADWEAGIAQENADFLRRSYALTYQGAMVVKIDYNYKTVADGGEPIGAIDGILATLSNGMMCKVGEYWLYDPKIGDGHWEPSLDFCH